MIEDPARLRKDSRLPEEVGHLFDHALADAADHMLGFAQSHKDNLRSLEMEAINLMGASNWAYTSKHM